MKVDGRSLMSSDFLFGLLLIVDPSRIVLIVELNTFSLDNMFLVLLKFTFVF